VHRFSEQAINFELADSRSGKITPGDARFVAGFGRNHNLSPAELSRAAA